jgi:hypothetical protein
MGIKLQPVKSEAQPPTRRCGVPKPHYKNSDLLFEDHNRDLETWWNKVLPPIIDWAGSHDNLFAVTADQQFKPIVKKFWDQNFPGINATDAMYAMVSP